MSILKALANEGMTKKRLICMAGVAVIGIGTITLLVSKGIVGSSTSGSQLESQPTRQQLVAASDSFLESVIVEAIEGGGSETVAAVHAMIDAGATATTGGTLSNSQTSELTAVLSRQLRARAAASADEYMSLAASEESKYRWVGPTDIEWRTLEPRLRYVTESSDIDRTRQRDMLRRVVTHAIEQDKTRLVGVGTGTSGGVVRFDRISHASQMGKDLLASGVPEDLYLSWLGVPTSGGGRFRKPIRSVEEILDKHGSTIAAECVMVVQTERGDRFVIQSKWYWDPSSRGWLNSYIYRKGYANVFMYF